MKTCTQEGCERKHAAKGLCANHYAQSKRPSKGDPSTPVVEKMVDAHDRKMEHFATTSDERDLQWWKTDASISPVHVPKAVKSKHPDRRFHWTSEITLRRKGKNYHGWEMYTDSEHPEGIKRGNDLYLTWMPEQAAQEYNDYVSRESSGRVRAHQDRAMESMDKSTGTDAIQPTGSGIAIGRSPRGGNSRGYSPDELKERFIKQQESRSRGRVHFT